VLREKEGVRIEDLTFAARKYEKVKQDAQRNKQMTELKKNIMR
jgi:hypothetical protein